MIDRVGRTAIDAAQVAGSVGLSLATSAATATGPVGWVLAGGLALAQGVIALVRAIQRAEVRQAEAAAWARRIGIDDPEQAPAYIVDLSRMSLPQLMAEGRRLQRAIDGTPAGPVQRRHRSRLAMVGAVVRSRVAPLVLARWDGLTIAPVVQVADQAPAPPAPQIEQPSQSALGQIAPWVLAAIVVAGVGWTVGSRGRP